MKKSIIALTLIAATLGLSACGSNTDNMGDVDHQIYAIYEQAKESGFTGTYEEWLDSIKGAPGKDGQNGQDGKDGATILTGATDPTANDGKNGDIFINTTTYDLLVKENGAWNKTGNIKGEKGEPGKDGTGGSGTGEPGKDGTNGKSAYEIYIEAHPEEKTKYPTEKEWLDALVNGKLGTKEKHKVTFDADNRTENQVQMVEHGEKATEPINPVKEGYTFNNWTYKGEPWSFIGYTVTQELYLKATYTANQYKVTFNAGEGTLDPSQTTATYTYDSKVSLPTPTKAGDKFIGWYSPATKEMAPSNVWSIAADTTLVAVYESQNFTITFDYNDGTTPNESIQTPFKKFITLTDMQKSPAVEGLTFGGWKNLTTGEIIKSNFWFDKVAENMTLEAVWKVNQRKYTLNKSASEVYSLEFKSGVTDTVAFVAPSSTNFVGSKNANLAYTFSDGVVKFDASWEEFDPDLYDTTEGKSKVSLKYDLTTTNFVVNNSVADVGGWGETTRLDKGDIFVGEFDPIVRTDQRKTTEGVYEVEAGKQIKLLNGKATLVGYGSYFQNPTASYTITDGVLNATFQGEANDWEYYEGIFEATIASDLSTLTLKQELRCAAYGEPAILANTVLNKVSGPTRG